VIPPGIPISFSYFVIRVDIQFWFPVVRVRRIFIIGVAEIKNAVFARVAENRFAAVSCSITMIVGNHHSPDGWGRRVFICLIGRRNRDACSRYFHAGEKFIANFWRSDFAIAFENST
jgi:hypothetical protein